MKKFVICLQTRENIKYISNVSPLLWTNKKSEAKIFASENEISMDLAPHKKSLELLTKELNTPIEIISIDDDYD